MRSDMKLTLMMVVLAALCAPMAAARSVGELLFGYDYKPGSYIGQRAANSEMAGIGALARKDGGVYVGDFMRSKEEGKGLLFAPDNGSVAFCDSAWIYYGGWRNGKKEGKGVCYNHSGKLIHAGIFKDDKPVGDYPAGGTDGGSAFGFMNAGDSTFVCQMKDGVANGYGIAFLPGRKVWFGRFRDGSPRGTGLIKSGRFDWAVVKWNGGDPAVIVSSTDHARRQYEHDVAWEQARNEMIAMFGEALKEFTKAGVTAARGFGGEKGNRVADIIEGKKLKVLGSSGSGAGEAGVSAAYEGQSSGVSASASDRNREASERNREKQRQSSYETQNYRSACKALDMIASNLLDRRNNPERYSHESDSEYVREVRKAQKSARKIIDDYKKGSGGHELPFDRSLLDWNPPTRRK